MEISDRQHEIVQCPYNQSHFIERRRMQFHISKCRKNHPTSTLACCDFNSTHQVPEAELQFHHEYCPDKKEFEVSCYREEDNVIDKYPIKRVEVDTEDNWDDSDFKTYDPQVHCQSTAILRKLNVESSAKKKGFYVAERQRHANFQEKRTEDNYRASNSTDKTDDKISKAAKLLALLKLNSKKVYTQNNNGNDTTSQNS